jgi:hypothetical protein
VNRRERRAAAARTRGRRTGYMHRVLAAMRDGALPKSGVHTCAIEHDPGCAIYRGGACCCVPDISVSGPDGVTVIDERGVGTKRARS